MTARLRFFCAAALLSLLVKVAVIAVVFSHSHALDVAIGEPSHHVAVIDIPEPGAPLPVKADTPDPESSTTSHRVDAGPVSVHFAVP